jgi:trk system potassium uptake protein TrkA
MQAFIAVTDNSEVNILACQLAKKYGVIKTVAEVENMDYIPLAEGIDIGTLINKKVIAASYIYRYTLHAHVAYVKCLTSTNAEMIELVAQPSSKITRAPISQLGLPKELNIGGVIRGDKVLIASGNTQIEPYDKVVLFAMQSAIRKIEKLFV